MADKWSLEGTPRKAQKTLAILLAVVGGLLSGGLSLVILVMAFKSRSLAENLPAAVFLFVLFLGCVYVLYRALFSQTKPISRRGRLVIGVVAVSLSALILLAAFVNDLPTAKQIFAIAISATGFAKGVQLININRYRPAKKGS